MILPGHGLFLFCPLIVPAAVPHLSSFHPAARLVAWVAVVVGCQALTGWSLAAALLVGAAGLGGGPRRRWFALARRSRWLLLSLLLLMAWGTPGELLWSGGGAPTVDGVLAGATQAARLLLMLAAVAMLVEKMPTPDLLAGGYVLLRPLRVLGLCPERVVARLALVLDYVEALPPPRDWRTLLGGVEGPDTGSDGPAFRFELAAVAASDYLLAGAALALAVWAWLP